MIKRHPVLFILILLLGLGLLTCLGGPSVLWALGGGTPNVAVDYVAKMNERAAAIPVVDRAWPVYMEAIVDRWRMGDGDSGGFEELSDVENPSDERWGAMTEGLGERAGRLAIIRRGASMPGLGYETTPEEYAAYRRATTAAKGLDAEADIQAELAEARADQPQWVLNVLLPQLGELRAMARLLAMDTRWAAHAGDADRVVANTAALLGIARHASDQPILINQLVEIAVRALAFETLRVTIEDHPGLLGDQQLAEIDAMLAGLDDGGRYALDLSGERMFMDDTVQRLFSDDGNGDGHITAEGLRMLGQLDLAPPPTPIVGRIGAGAARLVSPSRAEFVAMCDEVYTGAEEWARPPVWERGSPDYDDVFDELETAGPHDIGMWIISLLLPAFGTALDAADQINADRDATRLVVAMERARLSSGAWPASFDDLMPDYLDEIPRDPYDGGPMKLLMTDERPVVYSIGTDRNDDGGRHERHALKWTAPPSERAGSVQGITDGDWVFFPVPEDDE